MKRRITGAFFALLLAFAGAFTAWADDGTWELSEDGKYWMYLYGPDDPAKDEWIEEDGKVYYVDNKGHMKTGWVTNKSDGQKYYMGPDGAMCFNMVAPDDKYVGSEGTRVDAYDKYRKAIRSEIKKAAPKKASGRKKAAAQNQQDIQLFFKLEDINMDEYKDLIIMWGGKEAQGLCEVAVWIPADGKFQLSAEFDVPETHGGRSALYLDPEGEEVWLEMTEQNGDMNLFQMKYISPVFDNVWSFTMNTDEEGEGRYYVNGNEEEREDWELFMIQARQERGSRLVTGYVPATEENLAQQIDRALTEEERELWE